MTKRAGDDRAEPKAKAALLDFLRSTGELSSQSSVSAELILDNYRVRADVAVCDRNDLHCYEIKTDRDTLARLDRQLEAYARHANFVTVVAATRHINAIMSRVDPHVGIIEMVGLDCQNPLRVVRKASRSPAFDANALLSLVPVKDLQSRLAITGRLRRHEVVAEAVELAVEKKKQAVLAFFAERYGPNSRALWRATRRRKIRPSDLSILRRWSQEADAIKDGNGVRVSSPALRGCTDAAVYRHVGQSFGPIPDELKDMLAD
ncbi:sce7726 family protein [Novosphingobium sp. PY1]|uniref:sce7726 family protein n=1 Tax=Novosphingobium sp. PY1 TaxID=1882221 RepID=UPI001A90628A|nr:sce7726 family protein [Novosphingobium sp. PY1]